MIFYIAIKKPTELFQELRKRTLGIVLDLVKISCTVLRNYKGCFKYERQLCSGLVRDEFMMSVVTIGFSFLRSCRQNAQGGAF
jgi:hypothetical protein